MPGKFLVGVSAIIERDDTILLLQRSPLKDHGASEWEFVSGRVEAGESAEQAIKREITEETSLQVEGLAPFDTFYFLRGQEKQELIGITFLCRYVAGAVQLTDEHEAFRWTSFRSPLPVPLPPSIEATFLKYVRMKQRS